MAQHRRRLEKLASGFMESRILLTAVELDIFTVLGDDKLTDAEVADRIKAERGAAQRLLDALVALKVLVKKDGFFGNTQAAKRHLVAGAPEFLGDIMLHRATLWKSWSGLTRIIRTGKAPERKMTPQRERRFIKGMANIGRDSAEQTVEVLQGMLKGTKRLLDVGGGPAVYACAFARALPDAAVTVFDLPGPLEYARETIEAASLAGRVKVKAGDVLKARSLGSGYDAIFCSNFIHSFKRCDVPRIVKKAAEALRKGGRLIIKDFFIDEDRTSPPFSALFAVNMLVADAGDCFTRAEMEKWMHDAGVTPYQYREVAQNSGILVGRK